MLIFVRKACMSDLLKCSISFHDHLPQGTIASREANNSYH